MYATITPLGCQERDNAVQNVVYTQFVAFLFVQSETIDNCSRALQTHGLRPHITVPWYQPAILTERGHKVVG